jgi:hypothetical protein
VRRELGRKLLESSDPSADGDPREVEAAWDAEVARRIGGYRDGNVSLLTEGEVRDQLDR